MQNSNPEKIIATWIVLATALVICFAIFLTKSTTYPLPLPSQDVAYQVTNPEIIQDWMPSTVYNQVLNKFEIYLKRNNITSATITVKDNKVTQNNKGGLEFSFFIPKNNKTYAMAVNVNNYQGVTSSDIYINGKLQIAAPLDKSGETIFENFDSLSAVGLSSVQVNQIQEALNGFAQDGASIVVNPSSITPGKSNIPNQFVITFTVTIDANLYSAKVLFQGITDSRLILNQDGRQLLDTGVVDTSVNP